MWLQNELVFKIAQIDILLILQDEVNKLMTTTLREREREIIRLYYGLDNEFLTWEDISRRYELLFRL